MATRTVRLDDEAEKTLGHLCTLTGLSISEVLKRGLQAYAAQAAEQADRKPYDIYRDLDLGQGRDAGTPARETKTAVADLIRRKHQR